MERIFNNRTHIFLTGILAFCIPIYPNILPPLIILLILNWLLTPSLIVRGLKQLVHSYGLLLLVGVFGLYLLGMLYSSNLKVGYEIIETKLSLLIFPLIFSAYYQSSKDNLDEYLKKFIYGCIVTACICFIWAAFCFVKPVYVIVDRIPTDLGASYFYYSQLSPFIHTSYIAMYADFALIAVFHLVINDKLKFTWKWVVATIFLSIFVLLLSSKAGWIGLFIIVIYVFGWLLWKKRIFQALLLLVTFISSFIFFNWAAPNYSQRITAATQAIETGLEKEDGTQKLNKNADGTASRILVWNAAVEIIQNNFWVGVGTGDAKDIMLEKYKEKRMLLEYEHKLNSHNQFLNTFIALGVLGFTILLLCFVVPFYFSFKEKNFLFAAFIIIAGINFSVESMLETQAGVIFYAFFYSLLCFSLSNFNPKSQNPK